MPGRITIAAVATAVATSALVAGGSMAHAANQPANHPATQAAPAATHDLIRPQHIAVAGLS